MANTPETMIRDGYRFSDRGEPLRWLRADRALVSCPRCAAMAVATRDRVTCTGCGFAREGRNLAPGAVVDVVVQSRCPACGHRIKVTRPAAAGTGSLAVRCLACGKVARHKVWYETSDHESGAPRFHGLDLWLQTVCAGNVLWALDEVHLDFLERYVSATLREGGRGNGSLASRLPRWIKSAENRAVVSAGLARLRRRLPR